MSTTPRSSLSNPKSEFWFPCAISSYIECFDAEAIAQVASQHEMQRLATDAPPLDAPYGRVLADKRRVVGATRCGIRNALLAEIDDFAPLRNIKNTDAMNRFIEAQTDMALMLHARAGDDQSLALAAERDRHIDTAELTGVAYMDWRVPPRISRMLIVGSYITVTREQRSFAAVARLLGISESNVKYSIDEFARLSLNHLSDDGARNAVVETARQWQTVDHVRRCAGKHFAPKPLTREKWPELVASGLMHVWRVEFSASPPPPVSDAAIEDLMKRRPPAHPPHK